MSGNLTKEFAEEVAKVFKDRLGLDSQVLPLFNGSSRYKIEVSPIVKPKKTSTKSTKETKSEAKKEKSEKEEKEKSRTEEARESLQTERPTKLLPQLEDNDLTTLSRVFPEISIRKARIDYISNRFSDDLTWYIEDQIEYLSGLSDEELDQMHESGEVTNREMLSGLTRGKPEEQRLFALKYLKGDDEQPLPLYILNNIKNMLNTVANADVEDITSDILLNEEDPLGAMFLNEAADKGWGKIDENGNPSKNLVG